MPEDSRVRAGDPRLGQSLEECAGRASRIRSKRPKKCREMSTSGRVTLITTRQQRRRTGDTVEPSEVVAGSARSGRRLEVHSVRLDRAAVSGAKSGDSAKGQGPAPEKVGPGRMPSARSVHSEPAGISSAAKLSRKPGQVWHSLRLELDAQPMVENLPG